MNQETKITAKKQHNFIKQCRDEGLSLWECPNFLFIFTGLITIASISATYFLSSYYFTPETVIITVGVTSFIMMIISYLVNQGITKIALAKKKLSDTNRKLLAALEEAKQANKLREDFITMLVHDLRSPLDAIRLIIEMLQERKNPLYPKELHQACQSINHSSTSMLNLIMNLLDIARFERGKYVIDKRPGDMNKLINSQIKEFSVLALGKGIKLTYEEKEKLPPVAFDQYAISRIISNLLVNAIKFTPENGAITVNAIYCRNGRNIEKLSAKSGINWFIAPASPHIAEIKNSVLVAVTDNGIGINSEKLNKLFLSFSQVMVSKYKVKIGIPLGMGLGLSIAKVLIQAHNGIINVATAEDKGSTFYFTLPA